MNLIQRLRNSGWYCDSRDYIPKPLLPLYAELVYNSSSLVHYGRTDMFLSVAIETTSVCNRKCSFCPNAEDSLRNQRPQQEMDDQVFRSIIEGLAEVNYKDVISFQHYGEPLMDSHLEERIEFSRMMLPDAYLKIKSNGDLLSPDRFESLMESGLDEIFVTNYNNKEHLSRNLVRLQEYLAEQPKKLGHFQLRHGILYYYNRGGLMDIPKVQRVELKHCNPESHIVNFDVLGNVVLCSNDYLGQVRLGNILEQGIMDIWDSDRYKQLRQEIRRGEFKEEICKKCTDPK